MEKDYREYLCLIAMVPTGVFDSLCAFHLYINLTYKCVIFFLKLQ